MSAHLTQAQHSIRRLDFSSNRLGSFLPYGWLECTALQELILEQCGLEDRAIEVVATSHKRMLCPLLRLDLGRNKISDKGVASLIHILDSCQHPKLEHLNLGHNQIGDAGAVAMSEFLCRPATQCLLYLDLSHNEPIGDRGAIALADALRLNKQLLSFNLSGCTRISPEGGRALALMAQVNRSLQALAFEDGYMSNIRLNQEGLSILRLVYDYAEGTESYRQRRSKLGEAAARDDPVSVFTSLIQDDLLQQQQQLLSGFDYHEEFAETLAEAAQAEEDEGGGDYEDEGGNTIADGHAEEFGDDDADEDGDGYDGDDYQFDQVQHSADGAAVAFVDPFAAAAAEPPSPAAPGAAMQEQRRKNRTVFM